ncbi:MAG: hypothetical protein A4E35_01972 [Methanoregula sp. PtaU1.Bin051]|nr:MAG: hypothetical protein A4E35_01972 [Methanoregula sp. PtaU1.Bin051]
MGKLFVTADCHFGNKEVIRIFSRPFAIVEQMDRTIAAKWNRVVGPDDTVIVIGDFCTEPEDRKRLLKELS